MTSALQADKAKATLLDLVQRQRAAFNNERTVAYQTRIDRIDRCIALLVDHQQEICEAVNKDFGCRSRHVTLMTDIFTSISSLKNAKKYLKKWMKGEKRKAPVPLNFLGAKIRIQYQPKGIVGIMTPWNVPINMIFGPLADILAAGNRAIIKPSEYTPETAQLMQRLFSGYFEETEIAFAVGGPEVGAAFSSLPLDHLIFTGATSIGKMVMTAAAKNLTPVTLELGGKSPVIISDSTEASAAAETIITGKSMNSGQICISPDYAFVPASRLEAFISSCKEYAKQLFPSLLNNPDYVAMINERHFDRIKSYIDDARQQGARIVEINPGNENWQDKSNNPLLKIPLHLIVDPGDDMQCMQDEIFGPILNIKSYRKIDDCVHFINQKPRALALYYFGKDASEQQYVLDNTISGGVSVNAIAMHFACDDIPFGGVGDSGMGSYHGYDGFKTFSHAKSIYKEGFVNLPKLAGTLPPFSEKIDKMMATQIKK